MPKVKNILVKQKYELIKELSAAGYGIDNRSSNIEILTALYDNQGLNRAKTLDGITKERAKLLLRYYLRTRI